MSHIFVVIHGARNKCISIEDNDSVDTIYERIDQVICRISVRFLDLVCQQCSGTIFVLF